MADTEQETNSPALPDFDLAQFTPYRVALAAQWLSEHLSKSYQTQFGITIPEWRILVHLVHRDGVSVRDIEYAVALEKSKVSRTAARLEGRGLISKRVHASDKRLVHLSLTEEGRRLMANLLPVATRFQNQLEEEMGAAFEAFAEQIESLIDTFQPPRPGDSDA